MDIKPLTSGLGAEILGADIRNTSDAKAVQDAFAAHGVVIVRDQNIEPEDQLSFAKLFGEIDVNRFIEPVDGHPNIARVFKDKDQKEAIGEGWHTDHSYDSSPAMGSILHAIEVPPVGGDTVFASMSAAFEALSPPMQSFLNGLSAWHSSRHAFGASQIDTEGFQSGRYRNADEATQDALHPIVIKHPLSGKPCIYVNPGFTTHIDGLTGAESDAILNFLYGHCQQPEFQCRIRWRSGDLTMWDNRATWHKAINDYDGHRRLMHRVTVRGEALPAFAS